MGTSQMRGWERTAALTIAASLLLATACGRKHKQVAQLPSAPRPAPSSAAKSTARPATQPAQMRLGYAEQGVASWYGVPYHGRRAADGEIYDMETLVAAHRTMPFNTWLKVTNVTNAKAVTVRIIDRGPFVEGRIIDLSKAAARQIDLLGPGTAPVHLEVIAAPADIPSDDFYAVQVGAFSVYANAERARLRYEQQYGAAQLTVRHGSLTLWCVLVGKERSVEAAQKLSTRLNIENKNVFVVRLDETIPVPPPGSTSLR